MAEKVFPDDHDTHTCQSNAFPGLKEYDSMLGDVNRAVMSTSVETGD